MIPRPCVACGDLISSGSRCDDCKLPAKPQPRAKGHHRNTERWKRLSKRLRSLSPFCENCGATERLEVDHVIPIAELEQYGLTPYSTENLRVLCKTHNLQRGNRCTDAERAAVLARIAAKPQNRATG